MVVTAAVFHLERFPLNCAAHENMSLRDATSGSGRAQHRCNTAEGGRERGSSGSSKMRKKEQVTASISRHSSPRWSTPSGREGEQGGWREEGRSQERTAHQWR